MAFIELDGNFPIVKSNKASNFIQYEQLGKMGGSILEFVKANEETPFAFSMSQNGDNYEISNDVTKSLNDSSFFCYFDPSP